MGSEGAICWLDLGLVLVRVMLVGLVMQGDFPNKPVSSFSGM